MKVLRHARNLGELRKQFEAIKSGVAGDTNFTAAALLWLCEHTNGKSPETAIVKELRGLRGDIAAQRRVEETLADRIGALEVALQLKELASQLAAKAKAVEES